MNYGQILEKNSLIRSVTRKKVYKCPRHALLNSSPLMSSNNTPKFNMYGIRYHSDDCEVEGFCCLPSEIHGLIPALVFNRGGNREYGILLPEKLLEFAALGYAVLGSQYRGNCGGTGQEEFGGADVQDIIHLIDIAMDLPFIRKEGVYMVGRSRGGLMTYLACAKDKRIHAAAVLAGLSNCFMFYDRYFDGKFDMREDLNELIGGSPISKQAAYFARSPVFWAEKMIPPILICHGTDDLHVIPGQAYEMDLALSLAGKEHELIMYKGAGHSLEGTPYLQDVQKWFLKHPL